jgi:hypothetical protein
MPAGLQWLGAAGILISWLCSWTFRVNPFLAAVVKIQTERGDAVVTRRLCGLCATGPLPARSVGVVKRENARSRAVPMASPVKA